MIEKGSEWVIKQAAESEGEIHVSQITLPEIAAALTARARAPEGISKEELDRAIEKFLKECAEIFELSDVSRPIIDLAVEITQRRKIRGCDAIQLATALKINQAFVHEGLAEIRFVASDTDLLKAAKEEGLATADPEEHD